MLYIPSNSRIYCDEIMKTKNNFRRAEFLNRSQFCDHDHPSIKNISVKFKNLYPIEKDLAVTLFEFTQNKIEYQLGNWSKTASETLSSKKGTCTNKANLLVSLLRCVGIPAGYGVMKVSGKEYFGPAVLEVFKDKISERSTHVYVFVYLKGKWIRCDPSDDLELSASTSHFNPQSKEVDWDGEHDSLLNLSEEHIISDVGPYSNIDDILSKKLRRSKKYALIVANLYVEFLRKEGMNIQNVHSLEPLFRQWLKKKYPIYYPLYFLAFWEGHFSSKWKIFFR